MDRNFIKKLKGFFPYWFVGTLLAFIILLIGWFTGLSGYYVDPPRGFDEFIFSIIHYPHILFGLPIIIGFFIGLMLPKNGMK
jgi:hypothetical protein